MVNFILDILLLIYLLTPFSLVNDILLDYHLEQFDYLYNKYHI